MSLTLTSFHQTKLALISHLAHRTEMLDLWIGSLYILSMWRSLNKVGSALHPFKHYKGLLESGIRPKELNIR